jgi:Flp pilus assembly protein TadG
MCDNRRINRKGTALIEFVFAASLLCTVVFGIIEIGLFVNDCSCVHMASCEGAKAAASGESTSQITTRVISCAVSGSLSSSNITLQKQVAGTSNWVALGNVGTQNDANSGDLVKVIVQRQHTWITKFFPSFPVNASDYMVMRRQ